MPSALHEAVLELIRHDPAFAAQLLRDLLQCDLPDFREARLADATFTDVVPTEYRADAVVLLVQDGPVLGVIFEAQLQSDPDKAFVWPAYLFSARARHRCPFVLVVITPDAAVARWASKRIYVGGGESWAPLVVGPDGIPTITDGGQAQRAPHLAMLSVMAHGRGDIDTALAIALAALQGLTTLPKDQQLLYSALIERVLSPSARKAFIMHPQAEPLLSSWHREGFEKGIEQGIAQARAADVLDVLETRGLAISEEQRARVLACSDVEQLTVMHRRAVLVSQTADIFE